jgi:hypothetical protein
MQVFAAVLVLAAVFAAQQSPRPDVIAPARVPNSPALVDPVAAPVPAPTVHPIPSTSPNTEAYTLEAGTKIAVVLKHAISTKSARENDPVYAETSFPVVSNGRIVIPVGTYVQGVIQRSQRPGRVKGRGALVIHFNTLIFPSGYTLLLPGAIDTVPGAEKTEMKNHDGKQEGTIESQGTKGKDAGTIASTAGTGAAVGAVVARSAGGAGVGGLLGAGVGLASVLLTRGPDVRVESGTLVDMVLQRSIIVEHDGIAKN